MSTVRILAGMADRPPDAAITKDDEIERLGRGIESLAEKLQARDEIIADQEREIRRATYLAAALFIALCWRELWRVLAWLWRML